LNHAESAGDGADTTSDNEILHPYKNIKE